MGAKNAPARERFWRFVEKTDGCWLWTGSLDTNGYGLLRDDAGKSTGAHRFSYRLHTGPIAPKEQVCHSCDVRRCVRPDHLWTGTARANTQDAIDKGRFPFAGLNPNWLKTRQRGEKHVRARLTEEQVRQIRHDYRPAACGPGTKPTSMRGLARTYGVSKAVIQQIVNGAIWCHVT